MSTVFLSGSRSLHRLDEAVRLRLQNMVDRNLHIVIGDASGADLAMQSYLKERSYPDVTVFCTGENCRNNVGNWKVRSVDPVPAKTKRDFYAQKDRAMAALADFGFVLWDGKSTGSIGNVFELSRHGKKAVLYHAAQRRFHTMSTPGDVAALLCSRGPVSIDGSEPGMDAHAELSLPRP